MLTGIDPLLSGDLLRLLDHMGHNDTLLVTDAHYPSHAMGVPVIDLAVPHRRQCAPCAPCCPWTCTQARPSPS